MNSHSLPIQSGDSLSQHVSHPHERSSLQRPNSPSSIRNSPSGGQRRRFQRLSRRNQVVATLQDRTLTVSAYHSNSRPGKLRLFTNELVIRVGETTSWPAACSQTDPSLRKQFKLECTYLDAGWEPLSWYAYFRRELPAPPVLFLLRTNILSEGAKMLSTFGRGCR